MSARRYTTIVAAIVFLVTLAFMQVLPRPEALSGEASASRLLEVALICVALIISLSTRSNAGRTMPDAARAGIAIVASFAAWAFLTAFWSSLPLTAAAKALELVALATTAYRLVATAPGYGVEPQKAICDACAIGLTVAAIVLIGANIVYWGEPLHFEFETEFDPFSEHNRERLVLGQNHPLKGAMFLAITIVFLANSSFGGAAKLAGAAILGGLLLLCDARGITSALPVSLLFYMFLRARPSLSTAWVVTAIVFAGIGTVLLLLPYVDIGELLQKIFGDDVTSLNSRTDLWAYALDLAIQQPLGGAGYYGAREQLLSAFPFAGHAHNTFLEVFLTTGLLGAALLLALVALAFARLVRTSDALLGGLLPLVLVEGNLNPVLFMPNLVMFLFMVALFCAATPPGRRTAAVELGYEVLPPRCVLSGMRR